MKPLRTDFLIVGGGIVGLSAARALIQRRAGTVMILEKEDTLGRHASGRNSGVLHAGLYYTPGSLKAALCIDGAQRMKAYAAEKKLPCLNLGKVIAAQKPSDLPRLEALYQRGLANGVALEKWTPAQLRQHEPEAQTCEWAIYSPGTAVIDPKSVLQALAQELADSGRCTLLFSQSLRRVNSTATEAITDDHSISFGHLINTAGLFADRIAQAMGVGQDYMLLPFRGAYQQVRADFAQRIHGLIYPVPDPRLPFLGVHVTRSAQGDVFIGPTAEPAWGRENYSGLQGVAAAETWRMLVSLGRMGLRNLNGIRTHALLEAEKKIPGGLWRAAKRLIPALAREHLLPCDKVGIRAQLIRTKTLEFMHDFVIEKGRNSTHILNAVSPAFTASLAFADYIADLVLGKD